MTPRRIERAKAGIYARGEIDQAEYREKRALIASGIGGES